MPGCPFAHVPDFLAAHLRERHRLLGNHAKIIQREIRLGAVEGMDQRLVHPGGDYRAGEAQPLAEETGAGHADEFREVVCDLATGVGKTYLAAALVDYLAAQGIRNVLVVTPGKTIQDKTIANFTPGSPKYVPGADYQPLLITAENFSRGQVGDALHEPDTLKLFVFNVQQLIRPAANMSRKVREMDEFIGGDLYSHLQSADDLVVIADEHHVYRSQAQAFSSAIRDLKPRALIGLTATPDEADEPDTPGASASYTPPVPQPQGQ